MFRGDVGVSNLIATLILVAVAVIGGGFAYTAFRHQAQSAITSADLQVQDLNAVSVSDGTVYLSTIIKNVGTQRLTGVTVRVDPGGTSVDLDIGNLDPGQSGSANNTANLNAGESYPVRITATTPNDGSVTKTMTVRVRS